MPSSPDHRTAVHPLLLGTWFALLAGIGDVILFFVTGVLLHRYVHLSPHLVWISPLSSAALFAVPGLLLWALARWRPSARWPFATAAFFAFLTAWSLSTYATRVHPLAALVLALGIAIQSARVIIARPESTRRLIRYTLPMMVVVAIAGGLGLTVWQRVSEMRRTTGLPPAVQGAPNVLLIILDTVRAANLSLYGYGRPTSPQLEQFAKRGAVFDRAISTSPWTLPSHATLFTGRWPHELSADWRTPLDATRRTLAEAFSTQGYATAGFVANDYYASAESGLARGFQRYDDAHFTVGRVLLGSALGRFLTDRAEVPHWFGYYDLIGRKRAGDVNAEFLDWLARRDGEQRPFFVFLNYYDAHDPYIAPPGFDTLFDSRRVAAHPREDPFVPTTKAEAISDVAAYDESLTALDRQIGVLLAELERRGVLRNTIVAITSDHGEEFGEHGLMRHGKSLYLQELHVPLVLAFQGVVPPGTRIREPVSLRDLPATLVELARGPGKVAELPLLPGRSLARFWNVGSTSADTVTSVISEVSYVPTRPRWEPASRGDMASIFEGNRHLIIGGDDVVEMYAIDTDPAEERNVASSPELRDTVRRLAATLRALIPRRN